MVGQAAGFLPAAHYAVFGGIGAAMTLAPEASAAPIQSSISNLSIPVTTAGIYFNIITGETGTSPDPGYDIKAWYGVGLRFWAHNGNERFNGIVSLGGNTANLAPGTIVGSSSSFARTSLGIIESGSLQWVLNGLNYIGFRFTDGASATRYGWASVFVGPSFTDPSRKIVELWYESEANTAIAVGDTGATSGEVPEPSTTALLAIGAAGVLALRRRRQAKP